MLLQAISDKHTVGTKGGEASWVDKAGNVWATEAYTDAQFYCWATYKLVTPIDPANPPLFPVMGDKAQLPGFPDDVDKKTMDSGKGTIGAVASQRYWRDLWENIWLAQTYEDESGNAWTVQVFAQPAYEVAAAPLSERIPVIDAVPPKSASVKGKLKLPKVL